MINKRHDYYAKQDKKYRKVSFILKLLVSIITTISTIILGIRNILTLDTQVNIGLVLSELFFNSMISFLLAYYNFEKYWMRNVTKHIHFNILRDSFECDKVANKLTSQKLDEYRTRIQKIEEDNITYWSAVQGRESSNEEM